MFPRGFRLLGIRAGIKKAPGYDLGIIYCERTSPSAACFTRNRVKAAPVLLCMKHLAASSGMRAVVVNSGCANAATGSRGMTDAVRTARVAAGRFGTAPGRVLTASTGVIGTYLPMDKVSSGIHRAGKLLDEGASSPDGFARAIMTTDTFPKTASEELSVRGKRVRIWACAKGSGMINPDLATMLCFILTDASIAAPSLKKALTRAVERSFNCLTVDGDTSTNDTVMILASGASGAQKIGSSGKGYDDFSAALGRVTLTLAEMMARDGEGAGHTVYVEVCRAPSFEQARTVAKSIANSPLVKTAVAGCDPNWGRIIAAAGYAGPAICPDKMEISINGIRMFSRGRPLGFSERRAKERMRRASTHIKVSLGRGRSSAVVYTCDLTCGYIKINGSYRT